MTTMRFWAAAALALGGALAQPEPKPAPAPTPKAMPGMPGMPGPAPRPMAFLEGSLEALQAELEAKQGVLGRTIIPEEAMLAEMEARLAASQARIASAGVQLTGLAPMAALAGVEANLAMAMAQAAPASPRAAGAGSGSTIAAAEMARAARDRDRKERAYRDGRSRLDRRQYAEAVQAFDEVIAGGGNRKEGALYWKAYALTRLGRSDEALASLKDIPSESRWAGDAKALEVEARQASGRPVSPENQQDEELKLFALNALVSSDPDRVMPILDRLLKSSSSPRMKERALFVLAQMESAKARDTLLQVARGGGNPDLQLKAVEYLGIHSNSTESRNALQQIYSSSNDNAIKMAVLRAYLQANDRARVLAVAKADSNVEMRRYALQMLAGMDAENEIWQIYQSDSNPEIRQMAVQMLASTGGVQRLLEVARTEKDAAIRLRAVQMLSGQRGQEEALAALYSTEQDARIRRQVIYALGGQQAVKQIIAIAKKETDPELKRTAVQILAGIKSPEASEYLMELLK